jgi:hypothetical protein
LRLRARNDALHTFIVSRSARFASGDTTQVRMAAIVEGSRKLTLTFEDSLVELFDLSSDPGETRDLAPSMVDEADRLRRKLELWHDLAR